MKAKKEKLYEILENLSVSDICKFKDLIKEDYFAGKVPKELFTEYTDTINQILKDVGQASEIIIENHSIIIGDATPILEGMVCNSKDVGTIKKKQPFMLGCYNDENRNYSLYTAYFKFLNADTWNKATKLARITIVNPTYIHHNNNEGKEEWNLNAKERKLLDNIMHSYNADGKSVWSSICDEFNSEANLSYDFGIEIPDFTKIKEE